MDNHDDMESPSSLRSRVVQKQGGVHHSMHTGGEHHHDMYIGVEFKFEKHHDVSPF